MSEPLLAIDQLDAAFIDRLNSEGFSYQHAELDHARKLNDQRYSPWQVYVSEYPFVSQGKDGHADFVLMHARANKHVYLVAECKRANPAYCQWCFAKPPRSARQMNERLIIAEGIENRHVGPVFNYEQGESVYYHAFELKSDKKGDAFPQSGKGSAISDAAVQVCRAMNGLVEDLLLLHETNGLPSMAIVPVIFTTANLYVSEADLAASDLATGNLSIESMSLQPVIRLPLLYHQSPSLKHRFHRAPASQELRNLSTVLRSRYARTIYVVNSQGITSFLRHIGDAEFH